jgi:GDP-D-mannose 3', 5'-epimerase
LSGVSNWITLWVTANTLGKEGPLAIKVLVTGAGGFLGGHLVGRLLDEGHHVVAVDIKPPHDWWQRFDTHSITADLREPSVCQRMAHQADVIYHLAADMGGIAYINENDWQCASSVTMTVNMLRAAIHADVHKFLYTSSACVYPMDLQSDKPRPLSEESTRSIHPENGYGWEKLFSEQLCAYARSTGRLTTRIARLFNVYGPYGSWNDGREKAPAAICRKVAQASLAGSKQISIWGSGAQVRSFLYVDDCVTGLLSLVTGDCVEPVNLASTELVTIADFVRLVATVAGVDVEPRFDETKPVGVHARAPDTTRALQKLSWCPTTDLRSGIKVTYEWIWEQMVGQHSSHSSSPSSRSAFADA